MKATLIDKLCCPFDKHDLELKVFARDTEQNILEGLFTCTHCHRYFPIVHGVPMMAPDEYRQPELEMPMLQRWAGSLPSLEADHPFRIATSRILSE